MCGERIGNHSGDVLLFEKRNLFCRWGMENSMDLRPGMTAFQPGWFGEMFSSPRMNVATTSVDHTVRKNARILLLPVRPSQLVIQHQEGVEITERQSFHCCGSRPKSQNKLPWIHSVPCKKAGHPCRNSRYKSQWQDGSGGRNPDDGTGGPTGDLRPACIR